MYVQQKMNESNVYNDITQPTDAQTDKPTIYINIQINNVFLVDKTKRARNTPNTFIQKMSMTSKRIAQKQFFLFWQRVNRGRKNAQHG